LVTALINQHLETRPELEQTLSSVGEFDELTARIRWLSVLWLVRVLPAQNMSEVGGER